MNCAISKGFLKGIKISSNFSMKLHLCNIFMGLNPRWKYPRHGNFFFFFFKYTPSYALFFIPLSISQFSFVTQHKATEMYLFSCSYLKYLWRQHRHSPKYFTWGLSSSTVIHSSCSLSSWGDGREGTLDFSAFYTYFIIFMSQQ